MTMNDGIEFNVIINLLTIVLTACFFPFVAYFFKKNERLHEETKEQIGKHDTTLATHEIRLVSLEEWRKLHSSPAPVSPVIINSGEHAGHH